MDSGRIMELHHQGHHQSYVTQLNEFEEKYKVATEKKDLLTQLTLQPGLKFHAGGHVNHSLFWPSLCPVKEYTPPSPSFLKVLEHEFQSYDTFVKEFSSMLTRLQGSGWGWLCKHPSHPHHLHITWTANQDPVFPTQGYIPLLGIDVWEHAYYLDYLNQKGKYVNEIWKIINWKEVEKRYHEVTPSKV
ncbi:Superoxide dismutase [Mn], mitochondrial [Coelomomyces lativittatus]|nr:Superoxide dismutase [Mn], mitochondrial [Coelomomyces lativittatus]